MPSANSLHSLILSNDETYLCMKVIGLPSTVLRDLYTRMLLMRIVDNAVRTLHAQGFIPPSPSCRGREAAQVASAACIEVGKDFTLPYTLDLGVVLTIGMTPYEVFRSHLHSSSRLLQNGTTQEPSPSRLHWDYHKHNTITGPAPTATQILHAAGIAFACKLRRAPIVTVAYCCDATTAEADFLEGLHFAAQHQLPLVFICEQDWVQNAAETPAPSSCMRRFPLPAGIAYECVNGTDVEAVYTATRRAMQQVREGSGPYFLEMQVAHALPYASAPLTGDNDPLLGCQHKLQEQGAWDEQWAQQLTHRLTLEVERALADAIRDSR